MNGFYNLSRHREVEFCQSCHTAPNERLLQQKAETFQHNIQSCHTAPNERLLQPDDKEEFKHSKKVVIPLRMNSFYNTFNSCVLRSPCRERQIVSKYCIRYVPCTLCPRKTLFRKWGCFCLSNEALLCCCEFTIYCILVQCTLHYLSKRIPLFCGVVGSCENGCWNPAFSTCKNTQK